MGHQANLVMNLRNLSVIWDSQSFDKKKSHFEQPFIGDFNVIHDKW